jgi:hypothetical protein
MRSNRFTTSVLLASVLLVPPAFAQSKGALAKSVADFNKLSATLNTSLTELTRRVSTSSPNDKEMLKLANSQLGIFNATADGVVDLGTVASEVRDGGDVAIVRKHLAARCVALKSMAEGTAKYVESLAANIAAVATAAEVTKSRDLITQMGQHPLCNVAGK